MLNSIHNEQVKVDAQALDSNERARVSFADAQTAALMLNMDKGLSKAQPIDVSKDEDLLPDGTPKPDWMKWQEEYERASREWDRLDGNSHDPGKNWGPPVKVGENK